MPWEIPKKISLLAVAILFLFKFFTLILDAPRTSPALCLHNRKSLIRICYNAKVGARISSFILYSLCYSTRKYSYLSNMCCATANSPVGSVIPKVTCYSKFPNPICSVRKISLKVGTNENGSACGRWLSIGIYFALWWSKLFLFFWPPSWINSISTSAYSSRLNRHRLTE